MDGRNHLVLAILIRWFGCILLIAVDGAPPAHAQNAELHVAASVEPAGDIEVEWQGPDAPGDFIALAEPGAPATDFTAYARTSRGNPALLTAPAAGEYEVRYISAAGLEVMAAVRLTVERAHAAAALAAPSEARPGESIVVFVTSPGDPADYVTIVPEKAPVTALGPYARLRGATEVTLEAPEAPGNYEIRQVKAMSPTVLARATLSVKEAAPGERLPTPTIELARRDSAEGVEPEALTALSKTAASPTPALMALVAVDRGRAFRVAWRGPAGLQDRIMLVARREVTRELTGAPLPPDNAPVQLTAPKAPGDYEIRYIEGVTGAVLARHGLEVR